MNEARSFLTVQNAKQYANKMWSKGERTKLYEWVLMTNKNQNHKEGRPTGLRGGKMGHLRSTPRQEPSEERRWGWSG